MKLRTKTFLALLPVIVLITLTVLIGLSKQLEVLLGEAVEDEAEILIQANRKALEQHARVAAMAISKQAASGVENVDPAGLNRMIRDSRAVYGANEVRIYTASGLMLANGDERVGVRATEPTDPSIRRAMRSSRAGVSWRAEGLVSWAPILERRTQRGAVWVRFDLGDFYEFRRGSERRGAERLERLTEAVEERVVGFVAASVLIAMLVAAIIASITTRRTVRIASAAEVASGGDLSVRVEVVGNDEVSSLARRFNEMLSEIESSRETLAEREREARELEIARRIQTSVLPVVPTELAGYTIDAHMVTADEVGGDYYDVVVDPEGNCWVAIGDVSGHGLLSGLVMLMCQVALRVAVHEASGGSPADVFGIVNRLLVENVRERMQAREHMTLVILRCAPDGTIEFAGGHEDILCVRANGEVEVLPAPGPWAGVMDTLPEVPSSATSLHPGDRLWLHTDGITESRDASGELLGLERLIELARRGATPAEVVAAAQDFAQETLDDLTVVTLSRQTLDG